MFDNSRQLWGIMGGMGPLASAEFVKTIYEFCPDDQEQFAPPLILWSDPRMPDRTDCILDGRQDLLLEKLTEGLERLVACDVTDIVICCVTIHQVTDLLSRHLRSKIVSLLDLIFEDVLKSQKRYLLLCTSGTRKVRLFENHRLWNRAPFGKGPGTHPRVDLQDQAIQAQLCRCSVPKQIGQELRGGFIHRRMHGDTCSRT
jgi:aspartate racemase